MPRRLYLQPLVNRPPVVRWVHRIRCNRNPSVRWSGAARRTVIAGDRRAVWSFTLTRAGALATGDLDRAPHGAYDPLLPVHPDHQMHRPRST